MKPVTYYLQLQSHVKCSFPKKAVEIMYRSLVAIRFLHQPLNFGQLYLPPFFEPGRYRALSAQSPSASRIAQETSGRFTAHPFSRPAFI